MLVARALGADPVVEEGEFILGADVVLVVGADWPGTVDELRPESPGLVSTTTTRASTGATAPTAPESTVPESTTSTGEVPARRQGSAVEGRRPGLTYPRPPVKGLILSGGAGTRLRPITHTSAKQLVPVANKPILFYGIEDMAAAGIEEVGIVVGETHDEIEAPSATAPRSASQVTYIPQERAARPRPLRADRPRLPRRRRLRHVPRRQHAPAGARRLRRAVRGERAAAATPTLDGDVAAPRRRRSCCARCPTPTASAWPRSTPQGQVVGWSRSRSTRRRTSRSSACTCSPRPSTRPSPPSSRRRGASSRSPTPSSGSSTAAIRSATRSSRAGGSTPARRTRCSSRTPRARDPRPPRRRRGRRGSSRRGPGRARGGRRARRQHRPRPGDHRRRHPLVTATSARSPPSATTARSSTARSSTRWC